MRAKKEVLTSNSETLVHGINGFRMFNICIHKGAMWQIVDNATFG